MMLFNVKLAMMLTIILHQVRKPQLLQKTSCSSHLAQLASLEAILAAFGIALLLLLLLLLLIVVIVVAVVVVLLQW